MHMIRNRNGYWMSPMFAALFAPDSGAGEAGAAGENSPGGNAQGASAGAQALGTQTQSAQTVDGQDGGSGDDNADTLKAEIARLKKDLATQKEALDSATHQASVANKALKAKMTQEEIAAKEKEEADAKAAQELDELRREVARSKTVKSVMGKLGTDEETSSELADLLYGAADIDNAMLVLQKIWTAKENALKKEYGKLTPPGAGGAGDDNSPEAQGIRRARELGRNRAAVNEQAQKALNAYLR